MEHFKHAPNRLAAVFAKAAADKRPAFVAYVTAGDPSSSTCVEVVKAVAKGGADIVELGVPFSDPLADGLVNQLSAQRALDAGTSPAEVLEIVKEIRKSIPHLPIVLYTYLNPVAHAKVFGGFEGFCAAAVKAGVDAALFLDLTPEEDKGYSEMAAKAGLGMVFLVAPTTPENRVAMIAAKATSFVYYVCREGVTGERGDFASGVGARVAAIKKYAKIPVVVGFGISKPEHVKAAAASGADGVVVGSAIVRRVEAISQGKGDADGLSAFVKDLSSAI